MKDEPDPFPIQLSVILPAYEEAGNLEWLLPSLKVVLDGLGVRNDVIVVDTQTPKDITPELCRNNGVIYLPREGGGLYSHAVKTGIKASVGKYVLFMDADGSHPVSLVSTLWSRRNEADLVIASRYVKDGHTENPAVLIFLSLMVNVVFRVVLGLQCRDVSNSFRLYQGDALRSLQLNCENFDIVEEILIKLSLSKKDFTVLEVPFTFGTRKAGKTKRDLGAFALSYLSTLWRLYRLKSSDKQSNT
ncbi:MAG: glycosyltransferase [bacterium]